MKERPYYYTSESVTLHDKPEDAFSPEELTSRSVLPFITVNILDRWVYPGQRELALRVRMENPPRLGWVRQKCVMVGELERDDLYDGRYNRCI